jgi:hypothetical protein
MTGGRIGHFGQAGTAQDATREDAGDFEPPRFGRHAFGIGRRDHGKVSGKASMLVPSLVTYAVRRPRAHQR